MDPNNLKLLESATAWYEANDETVLLDLHRASYAGVNQTGTILWSMLAAGTTRTAMIDRLCDSYTIGHESAAHDVDVFLQQCDKRGYLA